MKKSKLTLDAECADEICVCTLRSIIADVKKFGDDPKRDKAITAACKTLLNYFGKPC